MKESAVVARQASGEARADEEATSAGEEGMEDSHSPVGFAEGSDVFASSYVRTSPEHGGMGGARAVGSGERLLAEQRRSLTEAGRGGGREVEALRRTERRVAQLRHDQEVDELRTSEDGAKAFDEALQELRAQNADARQEEADARIAEAAHAASEFRNDGVVPSVAEVWDEEARMQKEADVQKGADVQKDAERVPAEDAARPGSSEEIGADALEGPSREPGDVVEEEQLKADERHAPEDSVPDRLQSLLKQALRSRVAAARGMKSAQPEARREHREVFDAELRDVDTHERHDGEERPAAASYVRDAGRACGRCSDDNDLQIGAGEELFDIATRETVADVCGGVCNEHSLCAGFVFSNTTQRCYYKANTACQAARDLDHDCFTKADLWVPPADVLVPDADEEPHNDNLDQESGDDGVVAEKRGAHGNTGEGTREHTATKRGAAMRGEGAAAKKHGHYLKRGGSAGYEGVQEEDDISSFDDVVLGSDAFSSSSVSSPQAKVKKSRTSIAKSKARRASRQRKGAKEEKLRRGQGGEEEHAEDADKEERLDPKEQMRLSVREAIADTGEAHGKRETGKTKHRSKHQNMGQRDVQEEHAVRSFDDVVLGSELFSSSDDSSPQADSSAKHEGNDPKSEQSIQKAIDQVKLQIKELKLEKHGAKKADLANHMSNASKSSEFIEGNKEELKSTEQSTQHKAKEIKTREDQKLHKSRKDKLASKKKESDTSPHVHESKASLTSKKEHSSKDDQHDKTSEWKESKESTGSKQSQESKESKESKGSKGSKELREAEEAKESKESMESKESGDAKGQVEKHHRHAEQAGAHDVGVRHAASLKAEKATHKHQAAEGSKPTREHDSAHAASSKKKKKKKASKHLISTTKTSHKQAELDADTLSEILADGEETSPTSSSGADTATLDSAMALWAVGEKDTNTCPDGYASILTQQEAREAASFFKATTFPDFLNPARNDRPNGCFKWVNGAFYFNPREMPAMDPHGSPVCKRQRQAQVSLSGAAHTALARSYSGLKVAGDFYIVNAEHKKYLMSTEEGVSLWVGENGTLSDLGSVPGDLRWRLASKPKSPSFLLGNLGRSVYLTALGGHVNTHTPHGASQISGKNGSVLSWRMELVPNATDLYYIRFGSGGQYLEGSSLAAWDSGGNASAGPPKSSQWQLVRVTEGAVCNDYMVSSGCAWTAKWNCPGQNRSPFGNASSHGGRGSEGYDCCCELHMHAQALPDVPKHVSHTDAQMQPVLMTEQDEDASHVVEDKAAGGSNRTEFINELKMRIEQLEKSAAKDEVKVDGEMEGKKIEGKTYKKAAVKKVEDEVDEEAEGAKVSDRFDKEAEGKSADQAWEEAVVKQEVDKVDKDAIGKVAVKGNDTVIKKLANTTEDKAAHEKEEDWEAEYRAIVAKREEDVVEKKAADKDHNVDKEAVDEKVADEVQTKDDKKAADRVRAESADKKDVDKDNEAVEKKVDKNVTDKDDAGSVGQKPVEKMVVDKVANEAMDTHSHSSTSIENVGNKTGSLPPIGFIKTHRTGASGLARALRQFGAAKNLSILQAASGPESALRPDLGWPLEFPGKEAIVLNGAPPQQFDMICDRAVFNKVKFEEYLKPTPFFFSVLRTPASQIRSSFAPYHSLVESDWDSQLAWLAQLWKPKPPELGEQPEVVRASFQNPQAHDFGWYEHVSGSFMFDQDDKVIGSWVKKLDQSLGLVLLSEHMDEGLLLLRRALGLELADVARLRPVEEAAGKTEAVPTREQSDRVDKLLHVDSLLYSHFNATFWRRWAEAGDEEELKQELEELRHQAAALQGASDAVDGAGDVED